MNTIGSVGVTAALPTRVLAIVPDFIPSTIIQIIRPFVALHRAGRINARIRLEAQVSTQDIQQADIVVLCRLVEPKYGWLLASLLQAAKPYIYDLDDDLFNVPGNDSVSQYHNTLERLRQLTAYVTNANLVRVYAEPLRQRLLALNANTQRATPAFDFNLLPQRPPARNHRTIRIVYATSRQDDTLNRVFEEGLYRFLDQAAGQAILYCWGSLPPSLRGHRYVRFLPLIRDYESYIRRFAEKQFDIGLAPMLDTPFHNSKTNNKMREYGACHCAGVYSNTPLYASHVIHGETGLLVDNNPEAWAEAVKQLCENDTLRQHIQNKAYAYVRTHHAQPIVEAEWLHHFTWVLDRVPPAASPHTSGMIPTAVALESAARLGKRATRLVRSFIASLHLRGWKQTLAAVDAYLWQRRYQARIERAFRS